MRKILPMLALLPAFLAPIPGQAEVLYTINLLPDNFFPSDINNAGQIAGNIFLNELGAHAAVYADGAITDLGTFSGMFSEAVAINDAGTVVGNSGLPRGPWNAFVYGTGGTYEVNGMYALDINGSGAVVGQTHTGTAALYSQGTLTTLGYLGTGDYSTATGINDAGHVVGTSTIDLDIHSRQHPFLYNDGTLHDLGTLDEREFNSAVAINNAGQIAGYSEGPGGGMHAFLYENGILNDLGSFGGLNLDVGGMNAHGVIVGTGDPWEGPPVSFVSRNGVLVDLDTLIDSAAGWEMNRAIGINDHGQIIGIACRDDVCSPVRLDLASAVPEPGGVLLSACGLLMLAGRRLYVSLGKRRGPSILALLAVLLTPALGHAEAMYTVTRLPDRFLPTEINNAGQMAGAISFFNAGLHTGLYTDGVVTDLGTFGGTYSYAVALNEAGDLAGNFGPGPDGSGHAFLYRGGVLHDLGRGGAWGMNASAEVVGQLWNDDITSGFLYSQGTITELGHLGNGNVSNAHAINDRGQIVGESNLTYNGTPTHPFLYDHGTLTDLGTLAGQGLNRAAAINNAGQIAGYSEAAGGLRHAFLYAYGVMTDLGNFGGLDIVIGGINETGQIVANACRGSRCSAVRLDLASAVPEPGAAVLLLSGLIVLGGAGAKLRSRSLNPAF